jgi:chorismate--pyruvate lyase
MSRFVWRTRLLGRGISPALRSWLTEPGSLTARCQALCASFTVKLLHYGFARSLEGEAGIGKQVRIREVLLACDGVPVIFAHTLLCNAVSRNASGRGLVFRWLARLGSRSLGSLLFSHPGFVRGEIEYCRLDSRHPLFYRVAPYAPLEKTLWARRSRHRLGDQAVLVTEVFLPAIESLK